MNIHLEISYSEGKQRLFEAKRNLLDLVAGEIGRQRRYRQLTSRIEQYEGYARDALSIGDESLATEIAEQIALLAAEQASEAETNRAAAIRQLKKIVRRLESRLLRDRVELQDYLDAEQALEHGEWHELEEKMFAAGIGKRFTSLERIRAEHET